MEMAVQHRYGAVHISIPIDIQNADIPVNNKRLHSPIMLSSYLEEMIPITKRPIIVIGWGAWMADAYNEIYRFFYRRIYNYSICYGTDHRGGRSCAG